MRAQSDPGIVSGVESLSLRSWNTVGQLDDENTKDKWEKKKVKFNNCVRVVLIATKSEYLNSGLGPILWYSAEEYAGFKEEALCEYKTLISAGKLSKKEALNELYQLPTPSSGYVLFLEFVHPNVELISLFPGLKWIRN
jgi:hypothetical protein